VRRICRALGVSASGYYARSRRGDSARIREDRRLKQQILATHLEVKSRYGTPRIERELRRQGVRTSRKRVARLRRELGLHARGRRRMRTTTDSSHLQPTAPNLLLRRFVASQPDEVWVGDITYLSSEQGWLYLALLMDVFSRRIVGWSLSDRIDERLTLSALRQALGSRRPMGGAIHHTDRGGQYCGSAYQLALREAGVVPSMSRTGDCWDNAMAESLIKTIKVELGSHFLHRHQAHRQLFEYIEGFYNTRRLHSGIDYRPPAEVDRLALPRPIIHPIYEGVARPQTAEPPTPALRH